MHSRAGVVFVHQLLPLVKLQLTGEEMKERGDIWDRRQRCLASGRRRVLFGKRVVIVKLLGRSMGIQLQRREGPRESGRHDGDSRGTGQEIRGGVLPENMIQDIARGTRADDAGRLLESLIKEAWLL